MQRDLKHVFRDKRLIKLTAINPENGRLKTTVFRASSDAEAREIEATLRSMCP